MCSNCQKQPQGKIANKKILEACIYGNRERGEGGYQWILSPRTFFVSFSFPHYSNRLIISSWRWTNISYDWMLWIWILMRQVCACVGNREKEKSRQLALVSLSYIIKRTGQAIFLTPKPDTCFWLPPEAQIVLPNCVTIQVLNCVFTLK